MNYYYDKLKRLGASPQEIKNLVRETQRDAHNKKVSEMRVRSRRDPDYEMWERIRKTIVCSMAYRQGQVSPYVPEL